MNKRFTTFLLGFLLFASLQSSLAQEEATLTKEKDDVDVEKIDPIDEPSSAAVVVDEKETVVADDVVETEEEEKETSDTPVDVETTEDSSSSSSVVEEEEEVGEATPATATNTTEEQQQQASVVQSGPFIDLLGEALLSLEMMEDGKHAQFKQHHTNEILEGTKVVGLYFSADWCGPCVKFTPELVQFYEMINSKKKRKKAVAPKDFEIVWISRCRDVEAYAQYFTHMKWLAMPPDEATGQRGQMLSNKYKVQGIPSLVLLDEVGNVITTDARNKIPMDRSGVGFPWRNPLATLYMTLVPKSLRFMIKSQIVDAKAKVLGRLKSILPQPVTA